MCWVVVWALDFLTTSGIDLSGSTQVAAMGLADAGAGVAALVAPCGSRLALGVTLRLLGLCTLAAVALGLTGPGSPGALAGPCCLVLVCAREIFWHGWFYKVDALWGALCFSGLAALRLAALSQSTSEALAPEVPAFETWDEMPKFPALFDVRPVGPPLLLSFGCWISLSVLALGKFLEPIGEDLDEAGERWSKRSSRSFYDDEEP
ncbi:unnamed protein product [Effrenium voratum]|nr:unnamed protein product [Effrenium voratum]